MAVEEGIKQVMVANPRVMRDLPRLLDAADLELLDAQGTVYADIGTGAFWANAAEAYAAVLGRSGLLPTDVVEGWRTDQAGALARRVFFGASAYYTYLARRSSLTRATPRPVADGRDVASGWVSTTAGSGRSG